jgi:hypothetical protein
MKCLFFCPRWGSETLSWDTFMTRVKAAGYDGVEWAIACDTPLNLIDEVLGLSHNYGLSLIAQHYDTNDLDFNRHFDNYAAWLVKVKAYPWLKINSQTGKDYFSFEQNAKLIALAGGNVIHETHRGKFSFAAHVTKTYLETISSLQLTLDLSHWVSVAESFLEDQSEAMKLAVMSTEHIHARVGYTEAPQVPDPSDPEWQFALEHHLKWWDQVAARKQGKVMTITPEFGPYPYLTHGGDQWKMNLYMMNLLKKRYA